MGTAAKAIVIISVIFVANSVSAGSIAWTSSPEHGCKQWDGPESYDELLAVVTEIDASEQRDVELLKNETSDRGRTFITKTNGNYLVFMDSKKLCEERIASFKNNQKPQEKQGGIYWAAPPDAIAAGTDPCKRFDTPSLDAQKIKLSTKYGDELKDARLTEQVDGSFMFSAYRTDITTNQVIKYAYFETKTACEFFQANTQKEAQQNTSTTVSENKMEDAGSDDTKNKSLPVSSVASENGFKVLDSLEQFKSFYTGFPYTCGTQKVGKNKKDIFTICEFTDNTFCFSEFGKMCKPNSWYRNGELRSANFTFEYGSLSGSELKDSLEKKYGYSEIKITTSDLLPLSNATVKWKVNDHIEISMYRSKGISFKNQPFDNVMVSFVNTSIPDFSE